MTISKKLRFQILRRDNHTCRYCGASAPDVCLEVDHVVPRSLGGSDRPWNLVAACRDCNAGKSAMPVDEPLLEGPSEEAVRSVRGAREVVGHLWGCLPMDVASERVRADLANRFVDHHIEDGPWAYASWSRELMAFAQAVSDTADLAEAARLMPSIILSTLKPEVRARWLAEARRTFAVQDYLDASEMEIERFAAIQAMRGYGAAAGDVDLVRWDA